MRWWKWIVAWFKEDAEHDPIIVLHKTSDALSVLRQHQELQLDAMFQRKARHWLRHLGCVLGTFYAYDKGLNEQ